MAAVTDDEHQVLEFELGEKDFCVGLDAVDEIVNKDDDITGIPNSDRKVSGVMDLRGRTTTIIDPGVALDVQVETGPKYVIVFESEDRPFGWLIDDVSRVSSLSEEHLDDSVANGTIEGVFKQDGDFIVWVDPDTINM
ncbi:MAG: chemotaxis protein CheW [Halodesulfurarchaeum sp.]|nr:chemotaxis protein CheW [Halodesulfurarchaeum sp.]